MAIVGGLVLGGLLLLLVLLRGSSGGGFLVTVYQIPDGEDWRVFYRRLLHRRAEKKSLPVTWIIMGLAIGAAVISGLMSVLFGG